jgi:hypothetical protein
MFASWRRGVLAILSKGLSIRDAFRSSNTALTEVLGMMKPILFVIVMFAVSTPGMAQVFPPPEGGIKPQYDRFTDTHTVMLYDLQVAQRDFEFDHLRLYVSMGAMFKSGHTPQAPEAVGVIFSSWSLWNDRYHRTTQLHANIDGERKSYSEFEPIDRAIVNGKYVVKLGGRITYQEFQQLIAAKKVEMRLGNVEFVLTDAMRNKLRDFNSFIHP